MNVLSEEEFREIQPIQFKKNLEKSILLLDTFGKGFNELVPQYLARLLNMSQNDNEHSQSLYKDSFMSMFPEHSKSIQCSLLDNYTNFRNNIGDLWILENLCLENLQKSKAYQLENNVLKKLYGKLGEHVAYQYKIIENLYALVGDVYNLGKGRVNVAKKIRNKNETLDSLLYYGISLEKTRTDSNEEHRDRAFLRSLRYIRNKCEHEANPFGDVDIIVNNPIYGENIPSLCIEVPQHLNKDTDEVSLVKMPIFDFSFHNLHRFSSVIIDIYSTLTEKEKTFDLEYYKIPNGIEFFREMKES